jgi:class 3 adenylate cyclase
MQEDESHLPASIKTDIFFTNSRSMNKISLLLTGILLTVFTVHGQKTETRDTAYVNELIQESKEMIGTDSAIAIALALKAHDLAKEISYAQGQAYALKNAGMVYYMKGMYVETLDYWTQSLTIFKEIDDHIGISNMLNNIGAIYFNQGADDKALDYSLQSLQLAEKIGDTLRMTSALINIGSIYHNKKDPVALNYLLKALPLVQAQGDPVAYIVLTGDIGEVYFDNDNDAKALEFYQKSIKAAGNESSSAFANNGIGKVYLKEGKNAQALQSHNKALMIAGKFDDKLQTVRALRGIADVHTRLNNASLAIDFYNKARALAESMDDVKVELKDLYRDMAYTHAQTKDYANAFLYQSKYAELKDTLYNIESKKKLNQLQFDFELSKKQNEISLKEASIQSEKQARIAMMAGIGLLLVIAFIIYRSYLMKARTNKILDKQNVQIEHLLLNILPKEVANELQTSGESKPRHFEEVSILFTDFKGFTSIADKLSPGELVEELNDCFIAFDSIIEKYQLEKIKTIGDSYMCAGNIPTPDINHIHKIIKAALDIQAFMNHYNLIREAKNQEPWEIRIGLHAGPVVAGVVGKKKYAYDIWGGSVNIASRMESNGTPGKVNISAHMYNKIKDRFKCTYRGKIHAKNLGDLDMYYVECEITKKDEPTILVLKEEKSFLQK